MPIDHITNTSSINHATAYVIHRTARVLRANLLNYFKNNNLDVTPEQWFVMFKLHEQDGCAQKELADPTLNDYPNITRIVDALAKRGYLTRQPDPEDGRRQRIFMTPEGQAFMDRAMQNIVSERQRVFADVSDEEVNQLKDILARIEANVSHNLNTS